MPDRRTWRNGRRTALRWQSPQGRGGSSPLVRTCDRKLSVRRSQYGHEDLERAAAASRSFAQLMSALGLRPGGGSHSRLKRLVVELGIDVSHFLGQAHLRGCVPPGGPDKFRPAELLVVNRLKGRRERPERLRRALSETGVSSCCARCGISEWLGAKIALEVDHINGVATDNRADNLRLLCPNCHSQTETFGRRKRASD